MASEGEVQALPLPGLLESDVDHLEQYLVAQREVRRGRRLAGTNFRAAGAGVVSGLRGCASPLSVKKGRAGGGDGRWGCRSAGIDDDDDDPFAAAEDAAEEWLGDRRDHQGR